MYLLVLQNATKNDFRGATMNKKNTKKVVLISAIIICLALAINAGRFMIAENISKDINFEEINNPANLYDRAQGNYVLYTEKNGIKTAPFFWGERLYLYSIPEDISYLIKIQKRPFSNGFHKDMYINGDNIIFRQYDSQSAAGQDLVNISNAKHYKYLNELVNNEYSTAIMDDDFFTVEATLSGREYQGLSKINLNTGELSIINAKIDTDTLFWVAGNIIYYFDPLRNSDVGHSLNTQLVNKYPYGPPVGKINSSHEVYINYTQKQVLLRKSGTYVKIAPINLAKKDIDHVPEFWGGDRFMVRNNSLYYYVGGYTVGEINIENGDNQIIIDFNNRIKDARRVLVNYCTDYIIIDVMNKEEKLLLIYNYKGHLIREKQLNVTSDI